MATQAAETRSLTAASTSALLLPWYTAARAPCRAALFSACAQCMYQLTSQTPSTTSIRTGSMTAASTTAAPRRRVRACFAECDMRDHSRM